jgi:hypothetical protein
LAAVGAEFLFMNCPCATIWTKFIPRSSLSSLRFWRFSVDWGIAEGAEAGFVANVGSALLAYYERHRSNFGSR